MVSLADFHSLQYILVCVLINSENYSYVQVYVGWYAHACVHPAASGKILHLSIYVVCECLVGLRCKQGWWC